MSCLRSQIWIAIHVWFPKNQRLASTEQIFGTPYYAGLLLEQSMLYNRRADSGKIRWVEEPQHLQLVPKGKSKNALCLQVSP